MKYNHQDIASILNEPATLTYGQHIPGCNQIDYIRILFIQTTSLHITYDHDLQVYLVKQNPQSIPPTAIQKTIEKMYIQLRTSEELSGVKENASATFEIETWLLIKFLSDPRKTQNNKNKQYIYPDV